MGRRMLDLDNTLDKEIIEQFAHGQNVSWRITVWEPVEHGIAEDMYLQNYWLVQAT